MRHKSDTFSRVFENYQGEGSRHKYQKAKDHLDKFQRQCLEDMKDRLLYGDFHDSIKDVWE